MNSQSPTPSLKHPLSRQWFCTIVLNLHALSVVYTPNSVTLTDDALARTQKSLTYGYWPTPLHFGPRSRWCDDALRFQRSTRSDLATIQSRDLAQWHVSLAAAAPTRRRSATFPSDVGHCKFGGVGGFVHRKRLYIRSAPDAALLPWPAKSYQPTDSRVVP